MNVYYRREAGKKNQHNANECPYAIKRCVPIEGIDGQRGRSQVSVEVGSSRHWRDNTFRETSPEYLWHREISKIAFFLRRRLTDGND